MGKIVKYCSSCDEGFAERFGFCPDCGAQLQAFELNPVTGEAMVDALPATGVAEMQFDECTEGTDSFDMVADDQPVESVREYGAAPVEAESYEYEAAPVEEEAEELEPVREDDVIPATAAWSYGGGSIEAEPRVSPNPSNNYAADDDDYHVTVIEDKNTGQRNSLLLGVSSFYADHHDVHDRLFDLHEGLRYRLDQ